MLRIILSPLVQILNPLTAQLTCALAAKTLTWFCIVYVVDIQTGNADQIGFRQRPYYTSSTIVGIVADDDRNMGFGERR